MVRTQDWKYVHRYPYGPHELYDVSVDPGEETNLVADPAQAARVAEMRRELEAWFLRYVDPALDGARLPVRGHGQRRMVGKAPADIPPFA
jgi:arylsulfatase A-like enzyme